MSDEWSKRLTEQPGPVPNLSQAAKAASPEKAVGSTLKSQASESGSSDSSDSEEESPAAQIQPLPAVKTNAVPQLTNVKKAPAVAAAPVPAPPAVESSDDSSETSDSEEEIVPSSQSLSQQNVKATNVLSSVAAKANATAPLGKGIKVPAVPPVSRVSESSSSDSSEQDMLAGEAHTPPSLKQTVPLGKAPPADAATPQAASLLGSLTAKSRKPGLQPSQDTRLSQAVLPTQPEETSDSSSSSDSDEEETPPKQPPKPGLLQKPGVTQPAHSSSSESSEEEEATASQSLLTGHLGISKTPAAPEAPKTVPPQPVGKVGQGKAAVTAANSLAKAPVKAAPADSSSSDSSDSDTDIDQVAANHKAENTPPPGQEVTGASNKEKVAGKSEPDHASLKPSPVKKALAVKENDVGTKGVQVTPVSCAPSSIPQSEDLSSESEAEVTAAAKVPAVKTLDGLEEKKKKKKKEKKEKKEKKKSSSVADKAVKTSKSKDKENKKQKTSQKRKLPGEDGAVGQPKEKKRKGQTNEEVPKKKKKKALGDLEKLPGSKEKKKTAKKKKSGKEKKKSKKVSSEGGPTVDGSVEPHKKKKKKKKTAEPEGL
ncbi:treacle protein-like [Antrostomus carolinensis]|uniref:treacle protein-like n=1 Tax=Antrostomus carolinensis TaxID=279965 RepID=UPI0010A9827F|nr:treacle protein-like [Antrostomus carolinensis]